MAVLAIGLTISSLVISGALQNMRSAKDRVIATNLAREGIEAMRNIRDTNWLKFSSNRRECWNHLPGVTVAGDICNGSTPILPGTYIVYKNNEFRWKLNGTEQVDAEGYFLARVDIDESVDSDLDGEVVNDLDMYNHTLTSDDDSLGQAVQNSIFQRIITVEYLENTPDSNSVPSSNTPPNESINTVSEWNSVADKTALNRMRITSTVTWKDGKTEHNVELKTILTDYLGRTSLSG